MLQRAADSRPLTRIVIVSAVRTPVCKAKPTRKKDGDDKTRVAAQLLNEDGLSNLKADELLAVVLRKAVDNLQGRIKDADIGDIAVGNVLQPGAGAAMARMAMFEAQYPESVPVHSVNRQCASGLQAVAAIAAAIYAGYIDVGIAAGVESMTHTNMMDAAPVVNYDAVKKVKKAANCMIPMGVTRFNCQIFCTAMT